MIDNSLGDADYYDQVDYAGFGTRVFVMIVDFIVILLIGIALWAPFATFLMSGTMVSDLSGIYFLLFLIAIWLYLAPLKRSDFGTVGFKLFGVKLVSAKSGRPTLWSMTVRMMMWMFGPFNLFLDLVWLGADTESQSLRDCYLGPQHGTGVKCRPRPSLDPRLGGAPGLP